MSTTTYLQLEELKKESTNFRRCFFSEPPNIAHEVKEGIQAPVSESLETRQKVLLLKGAGEQYTLVDDHTVPSILHPGEILVKVGPGITPICETSDTDSSLTGTGNRTQPDRLERTVRSARLALTP
jgi:hypothetical protein